jgi:hypothetical protein
MEQIRERGAHYSRTLCTVLVALVTLVALGGCASIPQRAWQNGANISSSRAYRSMMYGDRSFQTMRQVYGGLDPYRSLYEPVPYPYFGHW